MDEPVNVALDPEDALRLLLEAEERNFPSDENGDEEGNDEPDAV